MTKEYTHYINDWTFLNYWLNYELNKSPFYKNIFVNEFYNNMENYILHILGYVFFINDEIYDINKDELDKIHILFNLYSNYYGIINEGNIVCKTKDICLDFSNKCAEEYKKGIIKCENIDSDFCRNIDQFKRKYVSLKESDKSKDDFNSNELIPLPTYDQALQEYHSELNRKITIVTISILCSIFGIILILFYLYKVQIN
ncbi:hypothetical protein PVNG_06434 [Plasmodium vivax North Korean]|uniref:Variable surface protein n=1 Tax=Plasmodium vivax North Korean TaxID=1035514 RepID=A0A0J9W6C1_PLAVI|nr:hypothetical protein PVNG_06434 [Plasmodium vivax North Korean]